MSFLSCLSQGNFLDRERVKVYPRIFLVLFILLGGAWASGLHEKLRPDEGAFVTDFINVYAAGVAAHEGSPSKAYDWDAQKNREDQIKQRLNNGRNSEPDEGNVPWLYPPMFLALAWLVAFLPYWGALVAYAAAGLIAYGAALRKLAPPHNEALWALAAFPGVFINLFAGQNGAITTALMAAGLFLLDTSPIAAGLFFGALSYKPHFFVLIPLVLFIGRYWKALAATLASACVYAGLSYLVFGADSWRAFFQSSSYASGLLGQDTDRWLGILHSVFSAVRVYGGSIETAFFIQGIVTLSAIMALLGMWERRSTSLAVRGASLAAAALLISPYSFVYDQVLLAIPIALLAREGLRNGFMPYEKTLLLALWLLPFLVQDSSGGFALPLTPPLLIGLMVVCWRRGKKDSSIQLYNF
jgi:alpha-1,2-mannosyltransferase